MRIDVVTGWVCVFVHLFLQALRLHGEHFMKPFIACGMSVSRRLRIN